MTTIRDELHQGLTKPSPKQKEAIGRYLHTLSAAALVGEVSLVWTALPSWKSLLGVVLLGTTWVMLFLMGLIFSKVET